LFFISDNKLYVITVPLYSQPQMLFNAKQLDNHETMNVVARLSSGDSESLLLEHTEFIGLNSTNELKESRSIKSFNPITQKLENCISISNFGLGYPISSKDGRYIAAVIYSIKGNTDKSKILVYEKSTESFQILRNSEYTYNTTSTFSRDNKYLATSSRNETEKPRIVLYSLQGESRENLLQGYSPCFSSYESKIAYLSNKSEQKLQIYDYVNQKSQEYSIWWHGFKNIDQWISKDSLLITMNKRFSQDCLAIICLNSSKVHRIDPGLNAPISGACYLRKRK